MDIYWLDYLQAVSICGDDCDKYLQGQVTVDVLKMADKSAYYACHCDAKGKVNTLFWLLKVSENNYFALYQRSSFEQSLADLKKYAIFSKVSFTILETKVGGVKLVDKDDITATDFTKFSQNVDLFKLDDERYFVISEELTTFPKNDKNQWQQQDFMQGIVVLGLDKRGLYLPQELNLHQIEGSLSFTKGCYLGQEGIARAKYRGAAKLGLVTFKLCDDLVSVEQIKQLEVILNDDESRQSGEIIAVQKVADKWYLQAVLNKKNIADSEYQLRLNDDEIIDLLKVVINYSKPE